MENDTNKKVSYFIQVHETLSLYLHQQLRMLIVALEQDVFSMPLLSMG